jgi:glucuronoarabinoxylan endo-1,4-beta-xylanase
MERVKNTLILIAMTLTGTVSYVSSATVVVDVNKTFQKISGFGTCSAWCGTLTAAEGELLWSTTKGAGLSLHRIQIQRTGMDASETSNTKLACSYGVKVWGTPWYCKNGVKVSGKDYDTLYEKDYQAWADVLAAAANSMKNAGTPLYAISSGNESDLGWTKFDAPTLAKWVSKYMGPTMASKAPDTKVIGVETCNWYGFSNYYKVFKGNADAWKYSAILATHEYGGNPAAYPDIQAAGKEFWQTEIYDTKTDVEDPGMGSALRVSKLVHEALTIANMNAWHFWWIKPCSGCNNGALWVGATKQPSKRLWIMGNWSRYVRPGFIRIAATEKPSTGITVTAFRDSSHSKVVIVVINNNSNTVSEEFSIPATSPQKITACITDPNRNLVEQPPQTASSTTFSYTLPAQSVTTLIYELATTSVLPGPDNPANHLTELKMKLSRSGIIVDFQSFQNGLTNVGIFNLKGDLIQESTVQTTIGKSYTCTFNTPRVPNCFYIVKLHNHNQLKCSKIFLSN